jgi:hypothetical protein
MCRLTPERNQNDRHVASPRLAKGSSGFVEDTRHARFVKDTLHPGFVEDASPWLSSKTINQDFVKIAAKSCRVANTSTTSEVFENCFCWSNFLSGLSWAASVPVGTSSTHFLTINFKVVRTQRFEVSIARHIYSFCSFDLFDVQAVKNATSLAHIRWSIEMDDFCHASTVLKFVCLYTAAILARHRTLAASICLKCFIQCVLKLVATWREYIIWTIMQQLACRKM